MGSMKKHARQKKKKVIPCPINVYFPKNGIAYELDETKPPVSKKNGMVAWWFNPSPEHPTPHKNFNCSRLTIFGKRII